MTCTEPLKYCGVFNQSNKKMFIYSYNPVKEMLWDGEKKSIYAQYRQDFHRYIENKNSLSILFKTAFILIWAGLFGYLHKVFS